MRTRDREGGGAGGEWRSCFSVGSLQRQKMKVQLSSGLRVTHIHTLFHTAACQDENAAGKGFKKGSACFDTISAQAGGEGTCWKNKLEEWRKEETNMEKVLRFHRSCLLPPGEVRG